MNRLRFTVSKATDTGQFYFVAENVRTQIKIKGNLKLILLTDPL